MNKTAVLLAALTLALGALAACPKQSVEQTAPPTPSFNVPTALVQEVRGPGYVELTGTVTGQTSVALSTKLMSAITFLTVEEGDPVQQGQLLVQLDDSDIQAMRSEAAAYRAEAAAALGEVATVVAQGEAAKAQAEAAVAQARAALADAQKDFERAERLVAEDTIPKVQRDKAELGVKVAEENLHRAEAGVAQAQAAIEQAQSKTPQIEAKQQQAGAKDAQAAALQDYASLVAPFDGVVTRKFFKQDQLAVPGQPILLVEDVSTFRVQLSAPDNLLTGLALGQAVDVVLEGSDGSQTIVSGEIVILGAAADPASHTVKVELSLPAADGLFSGRFARVRLPAGERTTLSVPESALVHEGELTSVWRVSPNGVLAAVAVEVGPAADGLVPIVRGLSAGDRIVTAPTAELFAGATVAGTAPPAAPEPEAAHE